MFVWRKEIGRMDVPADCVLRLYRSLNVLQIALPGLSSQEATVYLGAFKAEKGILIAVMFHFHASRKLVFYLHRDGPVGKKEAPRVLEEGVLFAESMGFMLSDMDYQVLSPDEQEALWESLPLRLGAAEPAVATPAVESATTDSPDLAGPLPSPDFATKVPAGHPPELSAHCRKLIEKYGRFLASF